MLKLSAYACQPIVNQCDFTSTMAVYRDTLSIPSLPPLFFLSSSTSFSLSTSPSSSSSSSSYFLIFSGNFARHRFFSLRVVTNFRKNLIFSGNFTGHRFFSLRVVDLWNGDSAAAVKEENGL